MIYSNCLYGSEDWGEALHYSHSVSWEILDFP